MCNISDYIYEEGVQKGIEKGREEKLLENARMLMSKLNYDSEQVLDLLEVPKKQWEDYKVLLAS